MKLRTLNKILNYLWPLLSLALLAGAWVALYNKAGSEFIFPSVKATLLRIGDYLESPKFWSALWSTLGRTVSSFLVSLGLALVFGVLAHAFLPVKRAIAPIIAILRAAPTVALMIILALITSRKSAPVIVALAVIFPMLYSTVISALGRISKQLSEMSAVYRVPVQRRIFGLYVPSVLPTLLGECSAALSFNVKLTVSAEIIAYTAGSLGGFIQEAHVYYDMSGLFALTVIAVVFAVLLELALRLAVFITVKKGGLDK